MPDVPNRDELERKLQRKLKNAFNDISDEVYLELEKVDFDVAQLPEEVWTKIKVAETAILLPFLESMFLQSSEYLIEGLGVGVDWAMANQAAADWARSYSTFLVGQIDQTSRERIAKGISNSIASYFEEGMTQGDLVERLRADVDLAELFTEDVKDRLGRTFGPRRAQMIARTEVTRAAAHGEDIVIAELRSQGLQFEEYWYTRNDEIVCPLCGPLNGKKRGDGWTEPPPRHPNCRCGRRYELVS